MVASENSEKSTEAAAAATPTSSPTLENYYRERLEHLRQQLPRAAEELKACGVRFVMVQYDGAGDEGQIEELTYQAEGGAPISIVGKLSLSEDELMDLFYDLTQLRQPGWENNDGACGEFTWDLHADFLSHTHNDRYTDYETTEYEGL